MISSLFLAPILIVGLDVNVLMQDGDQVSGDLLKVQDGAVVIKTTDGETNLDPRTIQRLSPTAQNAASEIDEPLQLLLRDGSTLNGSSVASTGDNLSFKMSNQSHALPRDVLDRAQLLPVPDGKQKTWDEILSTKHAADVVIVTTRSGELRAVEGVIGEIDNTQVKFQFDGDWIDVKREKVVGLIWFHGATMKLDTSVCNLTTRSGSRIDVSVAVVQDDLLSVTTPSGAKLSLSTNELSALNFASANLAYLSDLEPERTEQTEFLFFEFPKLAEYDQKLFGVSRDQTISFKQLTARVDGQSKVHPRGIGIHSDAKVVYRLAREYRRFQATATVDPIANGIHQLVLVVRLDGEEVVRHQLTSGDEPTEVDINLTGANRIEFEVLRGPDSNVGDHLNLCDARLTK